jgi:Tfp pilus assembly protein PilW
MHLNTDQNAGTSRTLKIRSFFHPRGEGRVRASFTRGFALLEAIIAAGITTLLVLVLCSFTMFSGKSFAALFNYVDLDDANKVAMDRVTRDVRQANRVIQAYTNVLTGKVTSITLENADLSQTTYTYNPTLRILTRTKGASTQVVLEGGPRRVRSSGIPALPAQSRRRNV